MPLKPIKGQMCRVAVEDGRMDYTIHGMNTYIAPWREGNGFVLGSTMEDRGYNDFTPEFFLPPHSGHSVVFVRIRTYSYFTEYFIRVIRKIRVYS